MANLDDKLVDYKSLKENTKLTLGEALAYDKGLAGGYNGDFPLTVATKGNIYRVPATNKFYMCITDYNGSNLTAPNSNFEELSVWKNRDKLENLIEVYENGDTGYIKFSNGYCEQWGITKEKVQSETVQLPISFKNTNYNLQCSALKKYQDTASIDLTIGAVSNKEIIINKSIESSFYVFWTAKGFWK